MNIIQKLKYWASQLKVQAKVLQVAYTDKRTPLKAKILIWITLGYLFSPIDLIPDFIPVLGILDDLIIVPLLIQLSIKMIPVEVMNDAKKYVETQSNNDKPRNWFIITIIVAIWIIVLYFFYKLVLRKWHL